MFHLVWFERRNCVADTAPALFAVCEETGEGDEADGWVVAWGIVREDGRTYAVPADDHRRMMALPSPERALWWFGEWKGARMRLVWLNRSGRAGFDAAQAMAAQDAA